MKKFILLLTSILIIASVFHIALATEETMENGSIGEPTENEYTEEISDIENDEPSDVNYDDAVLIDNEEDYNNLLNGSEGDNEQSQEELKKAFEAQKETLAKFESGENDEKFVITQILSDVQSEYTSDYYSYYYIIKYQTVMIRTEDGVETPAVVILSYDVSDNKSIKPLKAGDTVYGYVEYVSSTDSTYHMVNHGLTDSEIAYVSISHQDRTLGIILLTAFVILLIVLYAGKNGAKLFIPLFVIIDLLFIVFIPELEIGRNMLLFISLISFELIVLITVLKNGWSKKTLVAILSSIVVVILVATLGILFGNANGLTGKGIIAEENYDLLSNVYYIDFLMKTTIGTYDLYIAIIILITSVISASIASRITDLSEKYAGSEGMINNIIEEGKSILAEYPMIIATIFLALYLPIQMINSYNHPAYEAFINNESFVTYLAITLLSMISALIISPITAIISYLFMGKVEIKQISDN